MCTENTNLLIIFTMATKQPHFASSKKCKKIGFSLSIISCEQGGMYHPLHDS
jgi:hypothetical protein